MLYRGIIVFETNWKTLMVLGDGPGSDPDEHGIRDPGGRAHRGRLHLLLHPLQDWRTNDAQLREQVDRTVAVRGVAQRI